jgi:hypothetical protein
LLAVTVGDTESAFPLDNCWLAILVTIFGGLTPTGGLTEGRSEGKDLVVGEGFTLIAGLGLRAGLFMAEVCLLLTSSGFSAVPSGSLGEVPAVTEGLVITGNSWPDECRVADCTSSTLALFTCVVFDSFFAVTATGCVLGGGLAGLDTASADCLPAVA